MTPVTKEKAIEDLTIAIPYLRHSVAEAAKKGKAKLAITAEFPDGGGQIQCSFDIDFVEAVAVALGLPEQTEEDTLKAKAEEFVQKHGLMKP